MTFIVFAIIVGLIFAYFAIQNTQTTTVTFFNYPLTDIPIYVLSAISFLLGLVISWIFSLFGSISHSISMSKREHIIQDERKVISDLKKQIRELELENADLQGDKRGVMREKPRVLESIDNRTWFERVKDNIKSSYS